MYQMGFVSCQTLSVGLAHGWIGKADISHYATRLLTSGGDNGDIDFAVLAGADSLDDSEVTSLLSKKAGLTDELRAMDEWRYAKLVELNESEDSDDRKLDKLQDLYADFDYPQDMYSCSIYSQSEVPPLVAMRGLISSLQHRLSRESGITRDSLGISRPYRKEGAASGS